LFLNPKMIHVYKCIWFFFFANAPLPNIIGFLIACKAWDIAFSKDPQQRFIFLADGSNEKICVIVRETMMEITNFGDGDRQPGQFFGVHSIATDSKGNIYITETYEGKRLQNFVYKGIGDVASSQGTVWPKR
jgi:hypothetical protein